jgi:hypothetical protein
MLCYFYPPRNCGQMSRYMSLLICSELTVRLFANKSVDRASHLKVLSHIRWEHIDQMLTNSYGTMVSFIQPKGMPVMLLLRIVEVFGAKLDTGEMPVQAPQSVAMGLYDLN